MAYLRKITPVRKDDWRITIKYSETSEESLTLSTKDTHEGEKELINEHPYCAVTIVGSSKQDLIDWTEETDFYHLYLVVHRNI